MFYVMANVDVIESINKVKKYIDIVVISNVCGRVLG
jgi:hypothetical protein